MIRSLDSEINEAKTREIEGIIKIKKIIFFVKKSLFIICQFSM
jgi:hypothetical protein